MSNKENSRLGSVALLALLAGSAAGMAWADAGPQVTHAVLDDAIAVQDGDDVAVDPGLDGTVEVTVDDEASDDQASDEDAVDQDETQVDEGEAGDDAGGFDGEDDGEDWTGDEGDWITIDDGFYPLDGITDPDVIYYMTGNGAGPIVGGEEVQRSVTKDAPAAPAVAHDADGGESCTLPLDRNPIATCQ